MWLQGIFIRHRDAELETKVVPMHCITWGATEDRTAQRMGEGLLGRTPGLLKGLREALGLE